MMEGDDFILGKGAGEFSISVRRMGAAPTLDERAAGSEALVELAFGLESGSPDVVAIVRGIAAAVEGGGPERPRDHVDAIEVAHLRNLLEREIDAGRLLVRRIVVEPLTEREAPESSEPLAPPSRAPRDAQAMYDVTVIDDTGDAVAGIDVNLTVDDAPETLTTGRGGAVHSEGHTGSSARLRMLDVAGPAEKLEPQWSKPRSKKLPKGPEVREVPAGQAFEPLSVKANVPFTLILTRPPVRRVRMAGMLFDANKCFLLPQALPGILSIVAMHRAHPAAKLLLVGHAGGDEDLAGADIATDRADIVAAYLTNQPDPWLAWFKSDKPARSRWGTREVQLMLSALPAGGAPFYEGMASGVTDARTRKAIKGFQAAEGLTPDGKAGGATLKALVKAYLALEDTSLAKGIAPITHGCEGQFEDDLTTEGVVPDDRRLDAFFFDAEIRPAPAGKVSQAGSAEYPAWRAALIETRDFEHHGIHVQIIDAKKQPVPRAQVHLAGPVSGDCVADAHGFVSFFGLKPGEYTLTAQKAGIKVGTYRVSYPTAKTVPAYAKRKKKAGSG